MLEKFEDAVFGGPRPPDGEISEFLRGQEIRLPARVTATGAEEPGPQGAVPVRLHRGLVYWFEPVPRRADGPTICRKPGEVLSAIQQAILLHRRQELSGRQPAAMSELAEAQAFHLALEEVRNSAVHGGEQLEQWLKILLNRHQSHINEIRRRLVEFLGALTRGVEAPLAYPFCSGVRRIYETYRLVELEKLFLEICRETGELIARRTSLFPSGTERSAAVRAAFCFMEAHFTEPIGLREVASAVHVSPPHLARLFRRETGRTVVEYLQSLRISRARELLATTELTTLETALESGFESVEHFYRLFRRIAGTTPRSYRIARRL